MFAHWPGRSSCWYEDLRRIAAYGSVLGKFLDDDRLFRRDQCGRRSAVHYQADEYRSPYLKQDVAAGRRDPISRWVRYFSRRAKSDAARNARRLGKNVRRRAGHFRAQCSGPSGTGKRTSMHRIEDSLASRYCLRRRMEVALQEVAYRFRKPSIIGAARIAQNAAC